MSNLITIKPNSYNMDYYYSKYQDHHGPDMNEDTSKLLHVLLIDINLNKYK
ncbi:1195_t:CDS:1, partial [Cetraspora pellucida]